MPGNYKHEDTKVHEEHEDFFVSSAKAANGGRRMTDTFLSGLPSSRE